MVKFLWLCDGDGLFQSDVFWKHVAIASDAIINTEGLLKESKS